ncbi:unnamed protein product [Umbelopsis sp. WA50703]
MSGTTANSSYVPNLEFEYEWQNDILNEINVIGNSLSVASGMIVLIVIFALRMYDKQLVDRVSLRLSAAISVTDVISSAALLIYTYVTVEGGACLLSPFLIIFLTNLFLFLTVAIAFNLQHLFLHQKYYNPSFEKWYYILSVGLAAVTGIIPLAAGRLGLDEAQGYCWFSLLAVAIKLKLDSQRLDRRIAHRGNGEHTDVDIRRRKTQKAINRVVRRILLYPMVPIITQSGFIVSEIYLYVNMKPSYALNVWGVTLKSLPGFCNLCAFLIDPAIYNALGTIKKNLIIKYCGDTAPEPHAASVSRSTYVNSSSSRIPDKQLPVPLPTNANHSQRGFMPWFVRRFLLTSTQRQNGTSSTFFMMKEPLSSSSSMPNTPKMYNSPTFNDEESAHPTLSTNAMMKFPPKAHTHDPYTTFNDMDEDDNDGKDGTWVEMQPTTGPHERRRQRKEERKIIGGL